MLEEPRENYAPQGVYEVTTNSARTHAHEHDESKRKSADGARIVSKLYVLGSQRTWSIHPRWSRSTTTTT